MTKHQYFNALFLALFCLILCACTTAQTTHSYSGEPQQEFRPGPEGGVDRIWVPPEISSRTSLIQALHRYDSIIIGPVLVSFSEKGTYDGLDPGELKALTDEFRATVSNALRGRYAIVDQPGAKTLRLNIGLTGVERPNRLLATTSLVLPIGLGISALSKLTTGEHTNVGSASMEAALMDSQTGDIIFAVKDRRAGGKDFAKIVDPLSDARKAFQWWSKRLRTTLDQLRIH